VVSCCRKLAFVEFKCTRSAPWKRPAPPVHGAGVHRPPEVQPSGGRRQPGAAAFRQGRSDLLQS
jgi:hypothetical protein